MFDTKPEMMARRRADATHVTPSGEEARGIVVATTNTSWWNPAKVILQTNLQGPSANPVLGAGEFICRFDQLRFPER